MFPIILGIIIHKITKRKLSTLIFFFIFFSFAKFDLKLTILIFNLFFFLLYFLFRKRSDHYNEYNRKKMKYILAFKFKHKTHNTHNNIEYYKKNY